MTNPWVVLFLLFILFTVMPSTISFMIGRWGLPRLVWSRATPKAAVSDDEDL
jgi:hypothetical protein